MKDIFIKQIKHQDQQYDTIGNYRKFNGLYMIEVSKQKGYCETDEEVQAVALHEMIEMLLCAKRGISIEKITAWDLKHEKDEREPGEIKGAPYFKEHAFANKLEKLFLDELKNHVKRKNVFGKKGGIRPKH